MRTLVTSDWHLSDNPRDAYRHEAIAKLPTLLKQHQAQQLFCLGDLTHQKDRHPARLVNAVVKLLYELSRHAEIVVLRGNHDGLTPDAPFFQFVHMVGDAITWINKPRKLRDDLWLPHTSDYRKDWDDLDFSGYRCIFAHNTFEGTRAQNGTLLPGIPVHIFDDANVISGDIHSPQRVGPVTYVGAPYRVDFGDTFQPRALLLDGKRATSIPMPGPQKHLLEIKWPRDPAFGLADVALQAGDMLKIRVHISMAHCARWLEIKDTLHQWADTRQYKVHAIYPIVELDGQRQQRTKDYTPKSDAEQMQEFAKRNGVDERTLKAGMALLDTA